jgi:DNA-binding transcriptional ArsR family regulator
MGANWPDRFLYAASTMSEGRASQPAFTKPRNRLARHISLCLSVAMESDIFKALADPTRRSVFEKLALGGMNASDLRRGMTITQPAMSQHLAVLRSAGLVRERRDGRFVNYEVDPEGLVRIGQWLARYRAYWPRRIDDLKALLKDMDQ